MIRGANTVIRGTHRCVSVISFDRNLPHLIWLSIASVLSSRCVNVSRCGRMLPAENAARKRKKPDLASVACLNCSATTSASNRWKPLFQQDGEWKIPKGQPGEGCWDVALPDRHCTEGWLCHKCYQRRSVCTFGGHKKIKRTLVESQCVSTRCEIREKLEAAEALNIEV